MDVTLPNSKDFNGINTGPICSTRRRTRWSVEGQCPASSVCRRGGLAALRLCAQHWSLASQHGIYRLVRKIAPHHRSNIPKRSSLSNKLTNNVAQNQIGIRTHESPRQPRRRAHEQTLRPVICGWPVDVRISPLAHMLIVQLVAESRPFFQQSACDSK
jgi:hypothetical protein